MRRNAVHSVVVFSISLAAVGCAQKNPDIAMTSGVDRSGMDSYVAPAGESTFQTDAYPVYGSPTDVESSYGALSTQASLVSGTTGAARYHTVSRHDTLFGLARTYYADARRWKDIYGANRDQISDPNKIHVGQRLVIP